MRSNSSALKIPTSAFKSRLASVSPTYSSFKSARKISCSLSFSELSLKICSTEIEILLKFSRFSMMASSSFTSFSRRVLASLDTFLLKNESLP